MTKRILVGAVLACLVPGGVALAQVVFTKVQVADRIRKVEDGVDEFRKWAENRAENGQSTAQAAKATGRTRGRTATESQKEVAREKKDDLDDALGDLNRSTNRLRRKFDPTAAGGKRPRRRPQDQPGHGAREIRHAGGTLLGRAANGGQRSGSLLQPDTTGCLRTISRYDTSFPAVSDTGFRRAPWIARGGDAGVRAVSREQLSR